MILAGLQFVIAYQHVDVGTKIFRMFAVALLEAGLAVVFFMHLGSENRIFVTWVAMVTLLCSLRCSIVGPTAIAWSATLRGTIR